MPNVPALRSLAVYDEHSLQRRSPLEAQEFDVSIAPAHLFNLG